MRMNSPTSEVPVVTTTGRSAAVRNGTWRDTASSHGAGARADSRATELNSMVRHPMAEALAWAAAILSAITAVAGLFWSTLYRDAPFWIQQARGIDLATLLLAVPILVVSLLLLHRGWPPAMSVLIGVLLYEIYNYTIYSTSIVMNRLSFVYIAILGLCVWSLILLALPVATTSSVVLRIDSSVARVVGGFLLAVVVLFGLLWLSQIASTTSTGVAPTDVTRSGLPANPVYALDLAIFLPLAVIAAIGVLRGVAPAANFAVPMLLWVFLTSAGVAGGFLFAARAGDQVPVAILVMIAAIGIVAIVLAGVASVGATKAVT
jgi:hypothetical protein